EGAFKLAVLLHVIAFILFTITGSQMDLHIIYYLGLAITAGALLYQHLIVNLKDLSRIKMSFFSMNGLISLTLFGVTWLDLIVF
ncbi:MAG: 4-hydroxybenzoate octaprenyltransferase, partial [Desulfobulbaceae bacterium]|nr:4-hydroxybenzoate octaprenyltransferase [Desulfobulbaceae bacterium]